MTTRLAITLIALVAIAMIVCTIWPDAAALRYHPAHDALWRAIPGQFTHLGWQHLMLNLAGLAVLSVCAARIGALPGSLGALAMGALAVGIGLRFDAPPLDWYAGLSGALYGVFAWLSLRYAGLPIRPWIRILGALLCVGGGIKAVAGLFYSAGPGAWLDIPPAPTAHLYGYVGGLLWAASEWIYRKRRAA